jgi:excisionase family DNA binding protein
MAQDSTAMPPATGAIREEVIEKLEAALKQIAAELDVPVEKVRNIATRRVPLKKREQQQRRQAICRLRSDGYLNEEIAEALGLTRSVVQQTVTKLIADGKVQRRPRGRRLTNLMRQEREEQIIKRREDGYSNEAIGEELELSVSLVARTVGKLIQEGRVTPRLRGAKPLFDKERQEREEQIIKLCGDGYSTKAIAGSLGLSVGTVAKWIHRLTEEGRTEYRWSRATYHNIQSKRVQTIISMQKQRATLEEIGHVLGVTRERARQLIKNVTAEHGKEVFEPGCPLRTTHEAAGELGVSYSVIYYLCRRGEVTCRRRGHTYLIDEAEVEKLRTHSVITQKRPCVICCRLFATGGTKAIICSEMCYKVRLLQKKEGIREQKTNARFTE